jgi:aryl-alcohol dehydrogenase-like predicted oxidoreductase
MSDASNVPGDVFSGVEMGLGAWSWGDRLFWGFGRGYNEEDVHAAFETSLANGINLVDTAEVYAQGGSESRLGEFLKTTQHPVKVATKFLPYPWRLSRSSLLKALGRSLARLGRQRVELYQMHHPMPPVKIETWMEAMAEAYQRGWIGAVGVSNYDRSQMQDAYDALTRLGLPLASNQMEFHLLNRKIEKEGLLQQARDLGVTIMAYSPIASGVLSGKYTPEKPPEGFRSRRYNRAYLERIQPLMAEIRKIGLAHAGKTPAQVAINWTICKGTLPIPGAKNASQAEQNAGAIGWRLTDEEVARLDEFSDRVLKT